MRMFLAGVLALSLGGLTLVADDKKEESRADRLKAIQDESRTPFKAYQEALKEAGSDAAKKKKAQEEYVKIATAARAKAAEKALALAKENPKDDAGFDAAAFAYGSSGNNAKMRAEAFQLIAEHHVVNPKIESFVPQIMFRPTKEEAAFLAQALERNPSESVKATIAYGVARMGVRNAGGWDVPETEIPARKKAALAQLEKVSATYGEVELKNPRGKIADLVKKDIDKEIAAMDDKNSVVGKTTPEIEGEDLDGSKFKLSDYRGKVVLLDFWGHW